MNDPFETEINQLYQGVCSALADPTRIRMLYLLSQGSFNVTDLAEHLGIPQPTASRHLRVLRERDLVNSERDGTSVIYALAEPRVIEALDLLRAIVRDVNERRASVHTTEERSSGGEDAPRPTRKRHEEKDSYGHHPG